MNYVYLSLNTPTEFLTDSLESYRWNKLTKKDYINMKKSTKSIITYLLIITTFYCIYQKSMAEILTATRLTDWRIQGKQKKQEKQKGSKSVGVT